MRVNNSREELDNLELVAIDMGYGHLRPAQAISDFCGHYPILLADEAPLATEEEQQKWRRARDAYGLLSQAGTTPVVGPLLSALLDRVTRIPHLYPRRDLSPHTGAVGASAESIARLWRSCGANTCDGLPLAS